MKISEPTMEEMTARAARYGALPASKQGFGDTRIPEYARDIYNVIGRGVTEDPAPAPAIADARYFGMTYAGADPGKGAALHAHETIEVLVALTGRRAAYRGETGDKEIVIAPFDAISFPPGCYRGFRNVGDSHAMLMAIIGSRADTGDGGRVDWAPRILEQAHGTGLERDAPGNLRERGSS